MSTSDETYARYNDEVIMVVRQFGRESDRDDLPDLSTEDLVVAACRWVLSQHDRWGKDFIRIRCCALAQQVEILKSCDLIPNTEAAGLLQDLKTRRPRPVGSSDRVNPARRDQKTKNGTIVRNKALRAVIRLFANSDDKFDQWIAGLLKILSWIGWRPGEILNLLLLGRILSAPAEKFRRVPGENADEAKQKDGAGSGDRGLFERLEIRIGERYPENVLVALQRWIEEIARWCEVYDGEEPLMAAVRERIRRACNDVGVKPFSLYDLRHFAIANMKKSKRSRQEIAAVVNHLSDRTAGEHYGKARSGFRRPKAMFSVAPERIAEVRKSARRFPKNKFGRRRKRQNPKI